jgi:hypothetical protein
LFKSLLCLDWIFLEADSPGKVSNRRYVLLAVASDATHFAFIRSFLNSESWIFILTLHDFLELTSYLLSVEFVNNSAIVSQDFVKLTSLGVLFFVIVVDQDGPHDILIKPFQVGGTGRLSIGLENLTLGQAFVVMEELFTNGITLIRCGINRNGISQVRGRLIILDLLVIISTAKEQFA